MDHPVEHYWALKLKSVIEKLKNNNFDAYLVDTVEGAKQLVLDKIIPQLKPSTISWGGSMTFIASGLHDTLKHQKDYSVIDTYARENLTSEEFLQRRRQSLLVDLYFTSTNALTEDGTLVNLDMIGNRVAGLTFGPLNVIVLAGRNKVVENFEQAVARIKNYCAPANAMRLDKKTPCVHKAQCQDCKSQDRICNTWTITEKSFPAGRIKIVLINQEMGL